MIRNVIRFYVEELLAARPTPQAGGPPLVGCQPLPIQYIRSYPPYWSPFVHPQPEDTPCRGDRDPLVLLYYLLTRTYLLHGAESFLRS